MNESEMQSAKVLSHDSELPPMGVRQPPAEIASTLVLLTALLLGVLPASVAHAQTATATIGGIVVDATEAAVPRVVLTLVNTATALEREAIASGRGDFSFSFVPPGRYILKARQEGFAPSQLNDITLNVGDDVSVKLSLKVGSAQESVTVVDELPLVSENATVRTVVDRTFIANQPLNGRSFQTLIGLAPGVVATPSNVVTGGQFSVNGQRSSSNYFTVDGVSANFGLPMAQNLYDAVGGSVPSLSAQGSTSALASVDSVQEFAVQTSTFAPEFGRTPGAQVSIVTRSGTNDLHGSAFNYLRNDKLDANNWFANRDRLARPPLRQNDFGFTVGGPVVLPSLGRGKPYYNGRNRTFFFVSYEGLRLRQPQVSNPVVVPTLAARQQATGDVKSILQAYPLPNAGPSPTDPNSALFIGTFSNPSSLDATSVRIDHTFGWLNIFGRYHNSPSTVSPRNIANPVVLDKNIQNSETATFGGTAILSPRTTNDLRVNWSRSRAELISTSDGFGGATPLPESAAFPPFASSVQEKARIAIANNSILVYGPNQNNRQRQWNITETLTTTRGSHALKFGFDYRRMAPINEVPPFQRNVNFSSVSQALTGIATSVSVFRMDLTLRPIFNNYSLFGQDTWRITRRATVTYGLRWDVNPAPSEANGNLLPTVRNLSDPARATLAPRGTKLYDTTYGNVAPRLGISYALSEKRNTVIRGGVGLYYDLGYVFVGSAAPGTYPFGNFLTYSNLPLTAPEYSANVPQASTNPPYGILFAYQDGYKLPYTLQFNVALEQSIGANNAVTASYVGALGRRLGRVEALINPSAGLGRDFTRINLVRNAATSDYHALQLQFRRRFARGMQALLSYTFSKSLDIVSDESIINYQAPLNRYDAALDRGPSSFDVRHSFNGTVSYDIPSPRNSRVLRSLLGGFGIDALVRVQSAPPVAVLTNTDSIGFGVTTVSRPNIVSGVPLVLDDSAAPGGRRFNPAAFSVPPNGLQGNLGRNVLRGFGLSQLDVSIRRSFRLAERLQLQFRADAFNVLNHPNFASPEGRLNNVNFGRSTQMLGTALGGLTPLYQIGGPRSLQLSLKLQF